MTWLVGLALAATGPWTDPALDARVDFDASWTWESGGTLLEGQRLQAVHTPTGGGAALRLAPIETWFDDVPKRQVRKLGDLEGALTPEKFARVIALGQDDGSADRTVYLGLSDTHGSTVGRWVFYEPASEDEPARYWWHTYWRTPGHFAQLVAWVPAERLVPFAAAMRTLEGGLGTVSDWNPPDSLLYRTGQPGCEGPAMADRMAAVAQSPAYARARQRLGAADLTGVERTVTELRALTALLEGADACVHQEAPGVRACEVYERASQTERSQRLQRALPGCIAEHRLVQQALDQLLP